MPDKPPCRICGDYYAVRVTCTDELSANGCDGSAPRPHVHAICTKCKAEWVEARFVPEFEG